MVRFKQGTHYHVGKTKIISVLLYEFCLDSVNDTLYFAFCFEYSSLVFLAINLVV